MIFRIGFALSNSTHLHKAYLVTMRKQMSMTIFWSTLIAKTREANNFEFLHCPFDGHTNKHCKMQPNWLLWQCHLVGSSEGHFRNSKNIPPLFWQSKVDENILFPKKCFVYTISETKFTVMESLCF